MGTAMYVSPEQATGAPVTAASDIYSLGVVAYECLAGHVPFRASEPLAIAYAHKHAPVPPLPPDVPQPVADLVYDMLAKTPDRRPASVRVVADRADMLRDALALGGLRGAADRLGLTRGDLPAARTSFLGGGDGLDPGRSIRVGDGGPPAEGNRRRLAMASLTVTLCALAAAAGLYISGHIGNHASSDTGHTVGQIGSPSLTPSQVTSSRRTPSASPSTVVQQSTTSPPASRSPRPTKTKKPTPSPTPSPSSASPSPSASSSPSASPSPTPTSPSPTVTSSPSTP